MSPLDCVKIVTDAGLVIGGATFRVDEERLFTALTDTVEIGRWWGGRRRGSNVTWIGTPEAGSPWWAEGVFSGRRVFLASGHFLEVERPHRFVQSWQSSWAGLELTKASVRLEPGPEGTVLSLVHSGFCGQPEAARAQAQLWWKVIKWLHIHLQAPAPVAREALDGGLGLGL